MKEIVCMEEIITKIQRSQITMITIESNKRIRATKTNDYISDKYYIHRYYKN